MKQLKMWMLAAILICGTAAMFISCAANEDNATPTPTPAPEQTVDIPAQLKKGIWTEYDEALLTSGKYTYEELANMPAVGMQIDGDKANFFLYTAEGASDPVEGKVIYDNTLGRGTITFPTIQGNPLSDQTVNFNAIADDAVQFELNYEGQTTTANFSWLCENLDDWGTEVTDEDWKELMGYYQTISEDMGPDPSIDWGDLDEPLTWVETPKANTRIAISAAISMGLDIAGALFEASKPDPNEVINAKLDAINGKVDQVLEAQEKMRQEMKEQFDKVNDRLIDIATSMNQQATVDIFNERNKTYYIPLNTRNEAYFNSAYNLYNDNKGDLSKVSAKLGEYATQWVGKNEEYLNLTWNYIQYLKSVQHSTYGTGMANIYDKLTFDKYPWEHMGLGDRKAYRAYDMTMITKCLFMIGLYASYSGLTDIQKEGIYNVFISNIDKLREFCEFMAADPNVFRVCQIKDAHFVMHKEIQKIYFKGKNNEAPDPDRYGADAVYRPEWHEAGSVKINNPLELRKKLFLPKETEALYNYFKAKVYPNQKRISWLNMLVDGNDKAGGAVLAKELVNSNPKMGPILMMYNPYVQQGYDWSYNGVTKRWDTNNNADILWLNPFYESAPFSSANEITLGSTKMQNGVRKWDFFTAGYYDIYAAIITERY